MIPGTAGCEGSRLGLVLKPKAIEGYGRVGGQKPLPFKPTHILREFLDISRVSFEKLPATPVPIVVSSALQPCRHIAPPAVYNPKTPFTRTQGAPSPLARTKKKECARTDAAHTCVRVTYLRVTHGRGGMTAGEHR